MKIIGIILIVLAMLQALLGAILRGPKATLGRILGLS